MLKIPPTFFHKILSQSTLRVLESTLGLYNFRLLNAQLLRATKNTICAASDHYKADICTGTLEEKYIFITLPADR
jgi:hypothetical protein